MRPSIFGYVRLSASESNHMTKDPRKELIDYAEREGYTLIEIFTEHEDVGSSAFAALMDALRSSETPIVIVPCICHLARFHSLRMAMSEHIERETGAHVIATINNCTCERLGKTP
jgi:DNA invertase Pin-like site-specific DNA recombinase